MSGNLYVDKVAKANGDRLTDLVRGLAKAWANLDGTGTIALRDGLNVSSITDNGVGQYAINLSSAFTSVGGMVLGKTDNNFSLGAAIPASTGVAQIFTRNDSMVLTDVSIISATIHGDLA